MNTSGFSLSIEKKIMIAPMTVILFLVMVAGVSWYSLIWQENAFNQIVNISEKKTEISSDMIKAVNASSGAMYRVIALGDSGIEEAKIRAVMDSAKQSIKDGKTLIAGLENQFSLTEQEKEHVSTISKSLAQFEEASGSIMDMAMINRLLAIPMMHEGHITYTALEKAVAEFNSYEKGLTEKMYDESVALAEKSRSFFVVLVLFALIVSLAMTIYIGKKIVSRINGVKEGLKDAAEGNGDLTKRLEATSRDEVGELARWFNVFIEKMQTTIGDVARNASELAGSSRVLADISTELSQVSENISTQAASVSVAGEEMTINMGNAARTMNSATSNVNNIAAAIEEIETTISEIVRNTDKARSTTQEAVTQSSAVSGQMTVLSRSAQDIENVIETITDISEQVNLLALNATIEAARAGESGKGFAVVANEIKELAKQTSHATGEIKNRVNAIQKSTEESTGQMDAIARIVNDVNETVSTIATAIGQQSSAIREMNGNLSNASSSMNDVNANVTQSSRTSSDISSQISGITKAIRTMAESSSHVRTHSGSLSDMAGILNTLVARFRV